MCLIGLISYPQKCNELQANRLEIVEVRCIKKNLLLTLDMGLKLRWLTGTRRS